MLVALLIAAGAANVPEMPKEVPAAAARWTVSLLGQPAGQQAVWTEGGKLRAFFQFNDRGRGPKTWSTWSLRDGLPVDEVTDGVDYMKRPVHETFSIEGAAASWKSKAESGSQRLSGPAFYSSIYGAPVEGALLAKAALDHGGRIALLPGGECAAAEVKRAVLNGHAVALYALSGLDLSPSYLWLDDKRDFFGIQDGWFGIVREGDEEALPEMLRLVTEAKAERSRGQAARLAHRPRGALVIHDVSLFDAEDAATVPHQDVIVEGSHIVTVRPAAAPPAGAEVVEGAGKTLLPGLWDMHAHVGDSDGLLNLAAGVTTVRDLANDDEQLIARRKRIEEGAEIGTRIVLAGIIDGPGPFQGPTKMLAGDEKTAREVVDQYAAMGAVQIKIYSSVKPELVGPIAEEAHKLGLRLSGHIPAGLTAAEAVRLGYDEIQHANFLALNFMPDVKETRTPARFLEPAKRAADLDLASPAVRGFIQLLRERHVTLDPTL
ncbi:MAG: amidohydrolase family protein, partial [Myxococcales bacterium]